MGRKKKVVEEQKAMTQMPLAPATPEVKAPEVEAPPSNVVTAPEIPVSLDAIRDDAVAWAVECGFKGDFMVNGPDRVDYPQSGYGYVVVIKEQTGKQRMGSARFTSAGVRSYWSIDGIVTG